MFGMDWVLLALVTWGIGRMVGNETKARLKPMEAATGPASTSGPDAGNTKVDSTIRERVAKVIRDWRAKQDANAASAFEAIKWNDAAWWRKAATGALWTTLNDLNDARKWATSKVKDRRAEDGGTETDTAGAPAGEPKTDSYDEPVFGPKAGPDGEPEDVIHDDDTYRPGGDWGPTGEQRSRRATWWRYSPDADPWVSRPEKLLKVDVEPVRPEYPALPKPTPALEAFVPDPREEQSEPEPAAPAPQPEQPRQELGPITVERQPEPEPAITVERASAPQPWEPRIEQARPVAVAQPVTVDAPALQAAVAEATETIRQVNAPHQAAIDRGDRPAFRDSDGNLVWIGTREETAAAEVVAAPTIPARTELTPVAGPAAVAAPARATTAVIEAAPAPAPAKELETTKEGTQMAGNYVAIPGTAAASRPAVRNGGVALVGGGGMTHDDAKEFTAKIVLAVKRTHDPAQDAVRIVRVSTQAAWENVDHLLEVGIQGPVLQAWGDAVAHLEDAKDAGLIFLRKVQEAQEATARARRLQASYGDDIQAAIDRARGSAATYTRYYRWR